MQFRIPSTVIQAVALVVALAMALGVSALATPQASAAEAPEFARDIQVGLGERCPANSVFAGEIDSGRLGGRWCRPVGYLPILTEAECDQAQIVATFFPDIVCFWTGGTVPLSSVCAAPSIRVSGSFRGTETTGCVLPLLRLGNGPARSRVRSAEPTCIESKIVQESEAAQGLRVGNTFSDDGIRYRIIRGEPTCSFNCVDGFDLNCDGKLGDFCPVEIDRHSVSGAGECLAAIGTASD